MGVALEGMDIWYMAHIIWALFVTDLETPIKLNATVLVGFQKRFSTISESVAFEYFEDSFFAMFAKFFGSEKSDLKSYCLMFCFLVAEDFVA